MLIRLKNLRLRTIIGTRQHERDNPQDVVINVEVEFDGDAAAASDSIQDTLDYAALRDRIAELVQNSQCLLLERLCRLVLDEVMRDQRVLWASVEIDKPAALHLTDSVSVVCNANRPGRT